VRLFDLVGEDQHQPGVEIGALRLRQRPMGLHQQAKGRIRIGEAVLGNEPGHPAVLMLRFRVFMG
jgi:hypothetical protein